MHMTVGEQEMKTKYSGKWLGECEKEVALSMVGV